MLEGSSTEQMTRYIQEDNYTIEILKMFVQYSIGVSLMERKSFH